MSRISSRVRVRLSRTAGLGAFAAVLLLRCGLQGTDC